MRGSIAEHWREAVAQLVAVGIAAAEARLEAEVLLRHALGVDRTGFLARQRKPLPADVATRFEAMLQRRLQREPVAYVTGHREFYGLDFLVDQRVMIPRPETEGLVERVLKLAHTLPSLRRRTELFASASAPVVADIGTGSGCIAVTLAVNLPQAHIVATDISANALAVARENARRHKVEDRISFLQGDVCAPLRGQFDSIVSNPPYIPHDELMHLAPEIVHYEPLAALDGGPDGLTVIRQLLAQAPEYLSPGGAVLLEIGDGQGAEVARLGQGAFPGKSTTVEPDLAGHERYVLIA